MSMKDISIFEILASSVISDEAATVALSKSAVRLVITSKVVQLHGSVSKTCGLQNVKLLRQQSPPRYQ